MLFLKFLFDNNVFNKSSANTKVSPFFLSKMKNLIKSFSWLFFCLLFSGLAISQDVRVDSGATVSLNTTLGEIIGQQQVIGSVLVNQFAGIPYAQAGRWQHSQLLSAFPSSPFDARQFGPACAQNNMTGWPDQSEDCLFLNIWAPNLSSSSLKPVLLYVKTMDERREERRKEREKRSFFYLS